MSGRRCPRVGCASLLTSADQIVCTGDFHALASTCRGKKRLGEPAAAALEAGGRGVAYRCALCVQHHNGGATRAGRDEVAQVNAATVAALKQDARVGWQGVLNLADAWAPPASARAVWACGLDQRAAHR